MTGIAFSEPFFDPSLSQTQQVTAVFTANVNWTLQIQDVNTNTVRTITGSGGSMFFNWDGTGDGGASLPAGIYTYLVSAMANGEPLVISGGGGVSGSGGGPPPRIWLGPAPLKGRVRSCYGQQRRTVQGLPFRSRFIRPALIPTDSISLKRRLIGIGWPAHIAPAHLP